MTLSSGTRLGPYEIVSALGAGGMGEVYRARDGRLDRDVAIKVLPPHVADDADARARFEREARAISQLSHPHICALYDVGRENEVDYLVLEYLEGQTLAERLQAGPLKVEESLKLAMQMAEALDTAHRRGIIHRDLKPGNVMLTKTGAKLLDFGLAKATGTEPAVPADLTSAPTRTTPLTAQGAILGTFQYMAPEQIEGVQADARTDIWAFGCVLSEMLTGRRTFSGKTHAGLIGSILKDDPAPVSSAQSAAPPSLDRIVRTCLAKDPDERFQTAHDLLLQLRWTAEGDSRSAIGGTTTAPRASRERVAWIVAAAAGLAALGLAYIVKARPQAVPPRPMSLQLLAPEGFATYMANGGWAVISPDGSALVVTGREGLLLRNMESGETTLIADSATATYPFWSPDGQQIAFFRQGRLKRVAARGGTVLDVCAAIDGRGGTWNRDDVIVFAPGLSTGLYRVPAGGGTPEMVVAPTPGVSGEFIRYPSFLPDGHHFLFQHTAPEERGLYIGNLEGAPPRRLLDVTTNGVYAPPAAGEPLGRLLYRVNGTLMSQPFDLATQQLTGETALVAGGVAESGQAGNGAFSVSTGGVLVYASESGNTSQMLLVDRSGRQMATVGSPVGTPEAALSRDGRQVVYVPNGDGLFLQQVSGGPPTQLSGGGVASPRWSPDGRIVFSKAGLRYEFFLKHLGGAALEESLGVSAPNGQAFDWSADGKWIAYSASDNKTGLDIWLLPLEGERTPVAFLATPAMEVSPRFSPDGRWMAFAQQEAGRFEVFVQEISQAGTATGIKVRISADGGVYLLWRRDGKELVYVDVSGKIVSVPLALGAGVEVGRPQVLFPLQDGGLLLDMTPDAERFLVAAPAGVSARANTLTVVLNWQAATAK